VRPSLDATWSVMKSTLKTDVLLGSGPATFNTEWQKHKPEGINLSQFWNTSFPAGYGLLPTFVVTTGLLGAVAWILFLVLYVRLGIRALFVGAEDRLSQFFLVSSFFASIFLWVMSIVFVPRVTVFALAFLFSGIFVAVAMSEGVVGRSSVSFGHNAKLSFMAVLILIALLVGNVGFVYASVRNSLSNVSLARANELLQHGEIDSSAEELTKAINMSDEGLHYRALAEVYIQKISSIVNNSSIPDTERAQAFQDTLRASIAAAQRATEVDPSNYENWIVLGQIYESLIPAPLSVQGAYENAKKAYEEGLKRNPHSPEVLLFLARLEITNGNNQGARQFIEKSLAEKNNYAEAYFILTQMELGQNNLKQAVKSAETLAILSPNNPGVFFQLGLLKYNDGDFRGAAEALSEAVRIVPEYANAKYFLGLSLSKLGMKDLAIKEFRDLKKTNPDNQEVTLILANLEAGADPFKGFPPGSNSPQTREELPLRQ
jgi:tetratricopeptide (TPR) repeat protein